MQTQRAFSRLASGVAPLLDGPADVRSNGNGSLMRVLPLALWHQGSDIELVADACAQSRVTHGHERAQAVCAFYCLWARELLSDSGAAWDGAAARLFKCMGAHPHLAHEVEYILAPARSNEIGGSGYVLDSLWSAHHALETGADYTGVVRAAIALGHDTDTTACIAGGLAGIRHGLSGIPGHWQRDLRGRDMVQPLLMQLLGQS
jgi:ADP-ribosylglycohydrolase